MTPMWILLKDHLRRNWKSLTFMALVFVFFASYLGVESPYTSYVRETARCIIYLNYAILASLVWMNNDLNFLRLSRTLPFRKSTLANLLWGMSAVAPPAVSFLIVLLLGALAFFFGKVDSFPLAWPLLFLLHATLLSGVLTFVGALTFVHVWIPHRGGPAMAWQNMQTGDVLSVSYTGRLLLAAACAVTAIVLLFFPTPTRWLDLTPQHLVGMGLAAFLTWKSYRLRYGLLQSDLPQDAILRTSAKLESFLKSKGIDHPLTLQALLKAKGIDPLQYDPVTAALVNLSKSWKSAPLRRGSALAAAAQDLKTVVLESFISVLIIIGIVFFLQACNAWSGLVPQGGKLDEAFTSNYTFLVLTLAALSVVNQFRRLSAFGAVRALPLTGNQCVLLFLSYPYAAMLAVVPGITAYLWLTGYDHLSMLLPVGILLGAGLCPFAMFLVARFGSRAFYIILGGVLLAGDRVFARAYAMSLSAPVVCAGSVLLLAALGLVGCFGLRHLIENSSAAYKRKMAPQTFLRLFNQGLGR